MEFSIKERPVALRAVSHAKQTSHVLDLRGHQEDSRQNDRHAVSIKNTLSKQTRCHAGAG